MNWLLPGFLAASLGVVLPITLHFLRAKPNTVIRFPSLHLLAQTAVRDTRKHRLRRRLTLLMRCLAIALLAGAFARPFFSAASGGNRRTMVVAVDNSMSMQARGRWEPLRLWTLKQLDGLGTGDQVGILLMNPAPSWLMPVSGDVQQARSLLQGLKPGFENTRYLPALHLAGQTLATMPSREKTIVWMADEQRQGWLGTRFEETLPPGVRIRFADPSPAPRSQAAITSVRWLREPGDPTLEVHARLFSPENDAREVTVRAGQKIVARQRVYLDDNGEKVFRVPVKDEPKAMRMALSVSLNPDDLPADDTAWVAPVPEPARTVLFSPKAAETSLFLRHALGSMEKVEGNEFRPQPFPEGQWPAEAVAIVTGDCFVPPLLAELNRFADSGGALWIVVDGSVSQSQWLSERGVNITERAATEGRASLRDWDLEHPVLGVFAGQSLLPLMQLEFGRSYSLAGDGLIPVASWPDGTAGLAEWNHNGHRAFLSGFTLDSESTNWALQPTWVPFVHQTTRWLASLGDARLDWHVGDVIPLPSGEGTWKTVESPRPEPEQRVTGAVRPKAPGVFEYTDGKVHRFFAVNVPVAESDLTPWPEPGNFSALESKAGAEKQVAAYSAALKMSNEAAESQQRIWWWLLAICGALLLAELALANRTAL